MKHLAVAAILAATAAIGCGASDRVTRVVDGRARAGDYVPPEAYAAYLRGAIAEASGHLDEAIAAYEEATADGPTDPEPWTRIGLARCTRDPKDREADRAIDRALSIDEGYAPAWEARALCDAARGRSDAATEDARRALEGDPRATAPLVMLARSERATSRATRDRLLAAAVASPADAATWRALATWSALHGDPALEARALARVAQLDPRAPVSDAVARMVGEGAIVEARALAHAAIASGRRGDLAPLAIDDAIASGDRDEVLRVASRARVSRATAAARALLLGDASLAKALAAPVVAADPRADDAKVVLAAAAATLDDGAGIAAALRDARGARARIAVEPWLAWARLVARRGSIDAARALAPMLDRGAGAPFPDGDPLVVPAAVALAAQGVIDEADLGPNARIELAERRGERVDAAIAARADARHRLLALARLAPADGPTLDLARRLAPLRDRDRVIAVAFARLALAGAPGVAPDDASLARLDPADPLVAAAAFDLALHANDARGIPLARARLAAVARTPAELARVH